jgi:signal peptidase II
LRYAVRRRPLMNAGHAAIVVSGVVVLLDVVTKKMAVDLLSRPHRVHHLVEINVLRNSGDVVLRGARGALLGSLSAGLLIVGGPVLARWLRSRPASVACGLFIGGAAGNLTDRLLRGPGQLRGPILDWLTVSKGLLPQTFTTNFADVAVVSGLAVAAALVLRRIVFAPTEHPSGGAVPPNTLRTGEYGSRPPGQNLNDLTIRPDGEEP